MSQLEPDTSGVSGVSVDESGSRGFGLFAGYDIHPRLSLEGHVADLGESELSPSGAIGYQVAGLSALAYALGKDENIVRRQGFSVYGRLGLGVLNNDAQGVSYDRVNDVHLLAGAGIEYGFINGLAARVELIAHEADARYAQLGLLYRFGSRYESATASPEQAVIETAQPLDSASEQSDALQEEPDEADLASSEVEATDVDLQTVGVILGGVVEGVAFLPGSADLTDGAIDALSDVAQTLQASPDIRVLVKAHTDSIGDARENLQLSRRRALSVVRYLVDQGISGTRLRPQAFGESQPRESNQTAAGRAANRRVEFEIID